MVAAKNPKKNLPFISMQQMKQKTEKLRNEREHWYKISYAGVFRTSDKYR